MVEYQDIQDILHPKQKWKEEKEHISESTDHPICLGMGYGGRCRAEYLQTLRPVIF